jgi:hypothetical protein
MALIELILWASMALAKSLPSSELAVLTWTNLVSKLVYKPLIKSKVSRPF